MFEGGFDEVIGEMQHCERGIAELQARQLRAIVAFGEMLAREPIGSNAEFLADRVALVLSVSCSAAAARVDIAQDLTSRLPSTLAALERGEVDLLRARAISEGTRVLSAGQAAAVEERVLTRAVEQTAPQLRQSVRRAVLRLDPDGAQRRHTRAKRGRRVELYPADDGMATLWAHLPAAAARAIYDTVDAHARHTGGAGDDRCADERRADAFVDLMLGAATGPAAQVVVNVPVGTLLGLDGAPGELAGYGPIPAAMARELAADATWRRLLTDPVSGAVVEFGRTTYRPPAALADFVRARDRTCRFPSCNRAAQHCDLDHRVPFPEGPTNADNVDVLCRRHHRLKHTNGWQTARLPNGDYNWRSPDGRYYLCRNENAPEPPMPVAEPAAAVAAAQAADDPPPY
jgi:hypothetical protein